MNNKIIIVGSTGKLGAKLLKYTNEHSIPINAISCFSNENKIIKQKTVYNVKNYFVLSRLKDQLKFLKFIQKKVKIIYFLDYGSLSLKYLDHFLKFNRDSIIAIANKEMIIAGGSLLQAKIKKTNNIFIPLDSEHFSLFNSNINKNNVKKIFITASGGPFYFSKKINLNKVNINKVLSHPKWNMGKNNLIDSSNFINKILEIYELSYIYNIPLNKLDFLISKEAFIHSVIHYEDNTISINSFVNDMIITLIKPLSYIYKIKSKPLSQNYLNINNLSMEKPLDKRFKIFKYQKKLMKLSHSEQIKLMIINNSAHKLYLSNKLKYNNIVKYIMNEISNNQNDSSLKSFHAILKFINLNNHYYNTNV